MKSPNFKKDKIPFTQVANQVLNDPKLSAKAKGLYAYLYSKPQNWNFAIDRISNDFTDGRKAINAGLHELEENGYLLRERQGSGRVLYLLKSQMTKMDIRDIDPNAQNGKVPKRQSAEMDTVSNKELKVIKSISNKEKQFDVFWNQYPKKTDKVKCNEIWKRKKLDSKLTEILEFIEQAKETDRWRKGFIKGPLVFLRNESWQDDLNAYNDYQQESMEIKTY
jgi:hypothetical protein